MDDAHDGPYAREPQLEDLARIARALNEQGARYSPATLIRTKNTMRPSDAADRIFLQALIDETSR